MALADVRDELVAALNTVDGVTAYRKPPTTMRGGDAWVVLGGLERSGPAYLVTWRVLVLLPLDDLLQLQITESLVDPIHDALAGHGYVQAFEPVTYAPEGGATFPALQITLVRE